MQDQKYYISKSNMALGMRCPKALYLSIHRKDLKSKIDAATQARFDQGNEVGARAREYFDSEGAVIHAKPWEYGPSIKATQQAMATTDVQTIYEAAFSDGTLYSRADILHRKNGEWHLIEVKEGTRVKDEHIVDVAIQVTTMKRAGFKPKSYTVMHLNKNATYPDLQDLFVCQEITEEVEELLPKIEEQIDELIASTKSATEPVQPIGKKCKDPYECSFKEHCWKGIPEFSVFELPRVNADAAAGMMAAGLLEIKQLKAEDFAENELMKRAIEATVSGKPYVDRNALADAVKDWKFPLYFLDFETVMPAIPRYEGTTPYTQVCYQFSCHVLSASGELTHKEYLHTATSDPRERVVAELVAAVGPVGSVVSYNAKFEAGVMEDLAESFPQYADSLRAIIARLVDPLPLMRANVYHKDFRGSFSIKKVAPALLGAEFRYDDKEVSDGLMAGVWADRILRGWISNPSEVAGIREKLLAYCRQDTMAMVKLWEWMIK